MYVPFPAGLFLSASGPTSIYLAIQIKQNTATARDAILRSQTDRNMDNSKFHVSGRQDDYWWPTIWENIKVYLGRPGGQYWWHSRGRDFLDPKFIEYVDSELLS